MGIVTVYGASGNLVTVTVDGGSAETLASKYASIIAGASAAGSFTAVALTPGGTTWVSGTASVVEGYVSVGGSYTLTGNAGYLAIGTPEGQTTLTGPVTVNAASDTASTLSILTGVTSADIQVGEGQSGQLIVTAGQDNTFNGVASDGNWSITTGPGTTSLIDLGSGTNTVVSEGQDTIVGTAANQKVALFGSGSIVDLGRNGYVVDFGSDNKISVADNSTIDGAAGDTISAGAGLTFLGGTGNTTIAAGNATIWGTNNLDLVLNTSSVTTYIRNDVVGYGGTQTIDGASSTGSISAWAGSGNEVLIGGSGSDTLVAGAGSSSNTTMTGGAGRNEFEIWDSKSNLAGSAAGGTYTITDFRSSATNVVDFWNYGLTASGVQAILANETISGGNTTIALSDGSKITFLGVTDLKASDIQFS